MRGGSRTPSGRSTATAVAPADGATLVVGVAELMASARPGDVLATYNLGSCLGLTLHDPVARVGGLLHVMLPDSSVNPDKARRNPAMFVDTGVPALLRACCERGACRARLVAKVAGGACTSGRPEQDHFRIGLRNVAALERLLDASGIALTARDVGSAHARTVYLDVATGALTLKINGVRRKL